MLSLKVAQAVHRIHICGSKRSRIMQGKTNSSSILFETFRPYGDFLFVRTGVFLKFSLATSNLIITVMQPQSRMLPACIPQRKTMAHEARLPVIHAINHISNRKRKMVFQYIAKLTAIFLFVTIYQPQSSSPRPNHSGKSPRYSQRVDHFWRDAL